MDGFVCVCVRVCVCVCVCVGDIRCVGRALRVRKRRAHMRPRRGMSSLGNTKTGYTSIQFQRSYVSPVAIVVLTALIQSILTQRASENKAASRDCA